MMIWILLFGTNILADQGIKDKKKKKKPSFQTVLTIFLTLY